MSQTDLALARCVVMTTEMLRRLRNREPGLNPAEPKWQARLALATRWWDEHRGRYSRQLTNEYGHGPIHRYRNVETVTRQFAEAMLEARGQAGAATLGNFFLYSGASGVGKSTMWDMLLHLYPDGPFRKFVMFTTRQPRPGEENGREYIFVTEECLKSLDDADKALCCRMDQSLPECDYNLLQGIPLVPRGACPGPDWVPLRQAIEEDQTIWVLETAPDLCSRVGRYIRDSYGKEVLTFFVCPFNEAELDRRARRC